MIDENIAGFNSEELQLTLLDVNIESRPLQKPMHLQPVFKGYPYYGNNNVSEKLFKTGLCLPSGSNLTFLEKQRIKSSILRFIENH